MDMETIKEKILELLYFANSNIVVSSTSIDLFASETFITPRDMLFVCMELKKIYPIDYNKIVNDINLYSLDNLAEAIFAQL